MMGVRGLIISLLLTLLLGCATPLPGDEAKLTTFRQYHRQSAQTLLDNGELYAARTHLQIIRLTDPDNIALQSEINLLGRLISSQIAPQISQARQLIKNGDNKKAQKVLLQVLAKDPSNAEAFSLLKQASHALRRHKQGEETLRRYTHLNIQPLKKPEYPALAVAATTQTVTDQAVTPKIATYAPAKPVTKASPQQSTPAPEKRVSKPKPATRENAAKPDVSSAASSEVITRTQTTQDSNSNTNNSDINNANQSKPESTSNGTVASANKPVASAQSTMGTTVKKAPPAQQKPEKNENITMPGSAKHEMVPVAGSEPISTKEPEVTQKPEPGQTENQEKRQEKESPDTQADNEATYLAQFWQLYSQKAYAELIQTADNKPADLLLPIEFEIWLSDAHIALANAHKEKGDYPAAISEAQKALAYPDPENRASETLTKLKQEYADSLYKQGQKLLHSDLDRAIALWEMALTYNENMAETKHQLQRAYLMRKNLGSIRDSK